MNRTNRRNRTIYSKWCITTEKFSHLISPLLPPPLPPVSSGYKHFDLGRFRTLLPYFRKRRKKGKICLISNTLINFAMKLACFSFITNISSLIIYRFTFGPRPTLNAVALSSISLLCEGQDFDTNIWHYWWYFERKLSLIHIHSLRK